MAIKINVGQDRFAQSESNVRYKDVFLDLEEKGNSGKSFFTKDTKVDIRSSDDEGAIVNSIRNIFSTTPGERILEPGFGLNLKQWLFEPLDEFTAQEIGETIVNGIKRFEPRVEVKNVNIDVNYEQHEYNIQLVMSVPALNINDKSYDAILSQPGFNFLTNTPTS
mgnify:CR=1 FL=1